MSWWVSLKCPYCGQTLPVEKHSEGGTYVVGGSSEAELNVTYNYSQHYYTALNGDDGLRWLDGKVAKDVVGDLQTAVASLGMERSEDYWEATPGNAGYALSILHRWALEHPDGVFEVS